MRKPNYTGQDLPITHNTYHNGKLVRQEDGTMNLQPTWGGRARLLETLKQRELPNNLGKGALVLTQMGEASSSLTVIYSMGWGGNAYTEVAQQEMAEIAHTLRDKDGKMPNIVTVPTSALREPIAHKIAREGSFAALAEEVAPGVDRVAADSDEIVVLGNSYGARLGAAMPAALAERQKITELVLEDPPSSCWSLGKLGIAVAQGIEAVNMQRYIKNSYDTAAREAWDHVKDAPEIARPPLAVQLKDISAMAQTTGFNLDLLSAVGSLPEDTPVTLVSPELSRMNRKGDAANLMRSVSELYPKADLRVAEIGDSAHNVVAGNPAYFGKILELGRK